MVTIKMSLYFTDALTTECHESEPDDSEIESDTNFSDDDEKTPFTTSTMTPAFVYLITMNTVSARTPKLIATTASKRDIFEAHQRVYPETYIQNIQIHEFTTPVLDRDTFISFANQISPVNEKMVQDLIAKINALLQVVNPGVQGSIPCHDLIHAPPLPHYLGSGTNIPECGNYAAFDANCAFVSINPVGTSTVLLYNNTDSTGGDVDDTSSSSSSHPIPAMTRIFEMTSNKSKPTYLLNDNYNEKVFKEIFPEWRVTVHDGFPKTLLAEHMFDWLSKHEPGFTVPLAISKVRDFFNIPTTTTVKKKAPQTDHILETYKEIVRDFHLQKCKPMPGAKIQALVLYKIFEQFYAQHPLAKSLLISYRGDLTGMNVTIFSKLFQKVSNYKKLPRQSKGIFWKDVHVDVDPIVMEGQFKKKNCASSSKIL